MKMKVDEQEVVDDRPEEVKQQEDEDENEDEHEEDNQEYKTYTIKPFKNSDGEYFGLTIKGRTKEYLNAHAKIKETSWTEQGHTRVPSLQDLKHS